MRYTEWSGNFKSYGAQISCDLRGKTGNNRNLEKQQWQRLGAEQRTDGGRREDATVEVAVEGRQPKGKPPQ